MRFIENKLISELKVGDTAEIRRTFGDADVAMIGTAFVEGDGEALTEQTLPKQDFIAQDIWASAQIASVIATELPGPGTRIRQKTLKFLAPFKLGQAVVARVTVRELYTEDRRVILDSVCIDQAGGVIVEGEMAVIAAETKIRHAPAGIPELHIHARGARYRQLIDTAQKLPAIRTAVVHSCDDASIAGALEAARLNLIVPVLVGPVAKIRAAAERVEIDLEGIEIVDAPHSHAAAERAVALAREGKVAALMKGALHTDEVMAAVVNPERGLRTERRISHVFALDVPHYPKPLFVTDAAISISPDLEDKRDIIQNAIDLLHALGIPEPKVAILSAVETVYPKIKSTVDAAALCKMRDRGQITGALLDGPLAFDNAVSREAAKMKGLTSPVAGDADVLVVPDLEAGNMIAKQLIYLAGADSAGLVLGARVPIMLTSRADGTLARTASCALAQLFVHHRFGGPQ